MKAQFATSERTFTYRCLNSSRNLTVGVQLQPENIKKFKPSNFFFSWQQKKFSLWEIAKYSHFCNGHDQGSGGNPKTYIDRFRTIDKDIRKRCLKELSDYGSYVYTYIDEDGWIPPHEKTPKSNPMSSVAEAMMLLPDSDATLSNPASAIRKTLARQSNFRIMYIVAATVQDVDYVKKCFFIPKSTSMIEFVQGEVSNEGPWRKLINPDHIKEHVLCTIKIYQGGSLQVTPGFSEEEEESDEEGGPYRSIKNMRVAKTKGHRLTTFQFAGFQQFRYTLENLSSEPLSSVEEHVLEQSTGVSSVSHCFEPSNTYLVHIRTEIVSAVGFAADTLYCEYQVLAPIGWHCVDDEWLRTEEGEEFLPGVTQLASSTLFPSKNTPPGAFEPKLTFLMFLFVFLFGLLWGAENAAWIWGALLLCFSYNLTFTDRCDVDSTAHFGLPLSFTLSCSNPQILPTPQVLFQVCSVDWLGRHRVEGYGYQKLNIMAGSSDTEVSTWLPVVSEWSRLEDYFIGGGSRLRDLRFIATPPRTDADTSHKRRFLSKFGFATHHEGCGKVRIRSHVIEQTPVDTQDKDKYLGGRPASDSRHYRRPDGPVTSLGALDGDTTAEKASTYIRQLQARRARTFQELSGSRSSSPSRRKPAAVSL